MYFISEPVRKKPCTSSAETTTFKKSVETVTFVDPSAGMKNMKSAKKEETKVQKHTLQEVEEEMKKTRHEIMKFALNAAKCPGEREDAETKLAVRLGALPPKRKCVNYKELCIINRNKREAVVASKPIKIGQKKGKGKVNKQFGRRRK